MNLTERIRAEAEIASRPGQYGRLNQIAEEVDHMVTDARAEALKDAADAWQQGQWADAPRRPDRVQERIANAQFVTAWLRNRAEPAGPCEPEGGAS